MAENFHAMTLNNAGELQRSYLFKIILKDGQKYFDILMSSAKLPSMTVDERKIPVLSTYMKVAGMVNYDTWSATFMDNENGSNYKMIYGWQQKVFNRKGLSVGFPQEYKQNATLQLLSTAGDVTTTYTMEGLFPLTITSGDLAHANNDMIKYTVTFAMDKFTIS